MSPRGGGIGVEAIETMLPGADAMAFGDCVLIVLPGGSTPDEMAGLQESLSATMLCEAWHPYGGKSGRVQRTVEMLTGTRIAGRPFIVARNR